MLLVWDVSLAVSDPMAGKLGDREGRGDGDWSLLGVQRGGWWWRVRWLDMVEVSALLTMGSLVNYANIF